jgi:general secretion pathway protein L
LGVSVQGVAMRDDLGHAGSLDLLPSEQRGERESTRERFVHRALAVAAVALLALVLLVPVWQKRETIIGLHPVVAKAKQEAESADAVARELERQTGDYNFLLMRKHGSPTVLAIIEEVSRLLPDNTWVQQLEVKTTNKTREVQITGETSSSSKLIEIMEQSKLMQNAAPRGTVTRGSLPNTERFMIAAEVRPRTPPEPRPLLEAVAALPNPASLPPAPTPNVAVAPAAANPPAAPFPATVTASPAKAPSPMPQPKAPPAKAGPTGR